MEGHSDNVALFYKPLDDTTVISSEWVEHRPIGQLTPGATLEFNISGSGTKYVDLSMTKIRICARIVKGNGQLLPDAIVEGKPTPAEAKVGPVNLLLQSMWRQVDVSVQQQVISPTVSSKYPYKAYIENLLNYGMSASMSKLQSQLFFKDEGDPSDNDPVDGTNNGLLQRAMYTEKSKAVSMEGPIYMDICQQNRYILNGVPINFKFWPSSNEFVLMSSNPNADYRLEITEAVLKVKMVELLPAVVVSHAQALKTNPAVYYFGRSDLKAFSIAKGQFSCSIEDIYQGEIPNHLIIGMVASASYMGSYTGNPYFFGTFNCSSVGLFLDGRSTPSTPITPNCQANDYLSGYMTLFNDNYHTDEGLLISRNDYANGYCLYKFDTCDESEHEYGRKRRRGHTRVDITFSKALEESVTVLLFAKFPGVMEINEVRSVNISSPQ